MFFTYKASRSDGTQYDGTLEAVDKFALYKELHARGETVLSVALKKTNSSFLSRLTAISFGGVRQQDKIMFAKNLSAMLRAGLPLSRALTVLEKQIKGKRWGDIFAALIDGLSKGTSFSVALSTFPKVFPPFMISMVSVGEESGSLAGSLSIVGDQLEKSHALEKKVRGAMIYPAIIIGVMVIIAILMFVFVVPQLTATFASFGAALPLSTRIILGVSAALGHHYLIIILAALVVIVGIYVFSKTNIGRRFNHTLILKLPITGYIAKEVNSARTARTLSSLLTSGVDVVGALKITGNVVQNVHYQNLLHNAAENIQKGGSLEKIFLSRPDLYPDFIAEMVGVGEETGTLSKTLLEVAVFYENEVDEKTKDMSTIIEPVLMILIGIGVGFFALAIISPIYSLSNTI